MSSSPSLHGNSSDKGVPRILGWTLAFLMALAMWAMLLALVTSGVV